MTNIFRKKITAGLCILALCAGQVLLSLPVTAADESSAAAGGGNNSFSLGSLGNSTYSGLPGAASKVGTNIGKNYNEKLGINTDTIYGSTTNYLKDTFPEVKGMMSLELKNLNVDNALDAFASMGTGIPITSVDMPIVTVDMLASSAATTGALTAQLDYETGYSAVLGDWGNLDGRYGWPYVGPICRWAFKRG